MKEPGQLALTVDIEDWYHIPAVTGAPFSFYPDVRAFMAAYKERYDYLSEPTARLLAHLRTRGLIATFFVVADVIDYYSGLLESIVRDGHEIACHGLSHQMKIDPAAKRPLFSVAQFEDRTGRARERLRSATGQTIVGYRAPNACFGAWMLRPLLALGFEYDSSINPNSFFNKTDIDTSRISSRPYHVCEQNGRRLVELPWPYLSAAGLRFPTAGGPFLRFFPSWYVTLGLRDSVSRGDTLVYFHSIDICREPLPGLASRNLRRPFYFSTSGAKTEKKVLAILDAFPGRWTTGDTIARRFRASVSAPQDRVASAGNPREPCAGEIV